jgi:hypothetical protein
VHGTAVALRSAVKVGIDDFDRGRYATFGYVEKGKTTVTRYNMAYINHAVCSKDNGRVLGYDNAHGYHHRHHMGSVQACDFVSHDDTVERFQAEWVEIVNKLKGKSS